MSHKSKNLQSFDKIIKENINQLIVSLSRQFLQLDIQAEELQEISINVQQTISREPDFLRLVRKQDTQEAFVLHIEFQSRNDYEMPNRMLEYKALLRRKHRIPILQYVIYIGKNHLNMQNEIKGIDLSFRYNIINIRDFPAEDFLASNIPEVLIMSILGDFGSKAAEEMIPQIVEKLRSLELPQEHEFRFIRQLTIFSKLRNLQEAFTQYISNMAFTYKLEDDAFYWKGLEKGLDKGENQGVRKQQRNQFRHLQKLNYKMEEIAVLMDFSIEELEQLAEEIRKEEEK